MSCAVPLVSQHVSRRATIWGILILTSLQPCPVRPPGTTPPGSATLVPEVPNLRIPARVLQSELYRSGKAKRRKGQEGHAEPKFT